MFGLCINGRPVITDFQQVDANKFAVEVPAAESIHELAFFLLPGSALSDDYIACLYASAEPFEEWLLLGSVTTDTPSSICHVKWKNPVGAGSSARFGVSIEPKGMSAALTGSRMLRSSSFAAEDVKEFAKAIATDLFRYLDSYGHSAGPQAMNILDKWFLRFSKKMEHDPDFWKRIRNHD
mmetsp:Transcript_3626/g.10877  ORF Transcript_3626/g.10877 Transcript_3626/m.10877 type:complete len:180 (-) Transcript_3626:514-1053(-)